MELTSNDYRAISEKILRFQIMLSTAKVMKLSLSSECKLKIDGYEENGYDGTGAFVSTSKNLCIEKVGAGIRMVMIPRMISTKTNL